MTGMATPAKRKTPAKGKPSPKPANKSSASAKSFLRIVHSPVLRKKTLAILITIEQADDATAHRDGLTNLIVELTNHGMDYCFLQPLKLAKAGFIVEQSANIGMSGVQQVMASVIRQIIGRMGSPQLLSVCKSIRQLMR